MLLRGRVRSPLELPKNFMVLVSQYRNIFLANPAMEVAWLVDNVCGSSDMEPAKLTRSDTFFFLKVF